MNAARVLRGLVLGAIGGFLGWVLVELLGLARDDATAIVWSNVLALGAVIGLMDGLALGVAEGITGGTTTKFWRAMGFGAITGTAGGMLGLYFGQLFYQSLLGAAGITREEQGGFTQFLIHLVARSVGWGLIGTFVGSAVGFPSGSSQKVRNGFIGGTIGGLIGGFAFQIFAVVTMAGGMMPRLIGLTSIGAAVGFFVSLVDEALKSAWVKILVGRNEGREVVIDKPVAIVGRDELADVPVFGDPSVSRHHATIFRQNRQYLIQDQGSPAGTLVNGQRVSQQYLRDGDNIQLGGVRLQFFEKAGGAPARHRVDSPRPPVTSVSPAAASLCAFCGGAKDPVTGTCACAVAEQSGIGVNPFGVETAAWPAAAGIGATPGFTPARLVGTTGPYAGRTFDLPAAGATIGRDPGNDIALPLDNMVSRRHASITPEPGGFRLRDEGSSNGTFVNSQRIQEHLLRPGDEIRIGATVFRFDG